MKENKKNTKLKMYIIIPIIVVALCAIAIITAILLGMPEKVDAARVSKQIDLGNKYLAAADYDNAKVTFNKALKINPKSVEAASGMAKVYNKQNEPEKAVKYLKQASDNLTDQSQAKELQKVYKETKQQMSSSAQTAKNSNTKSTSKTGTSSKIVNNKATNDENNSSDEYENDEELQDIEDAIAEYLRLIKKPEPTPTEEPEPTPTEEPEPTPEMTEFGIPVATEDGTMDSGVYEESSVEVDSIENSIGELLPGEPIVEEEMPRGEEIEESEEEPAYDPNLDETAEAETENMSTEITDYEAFWNTYITETLSAELPSAEFLYTSIAYTYENRMEAENLMNGRLAEKQLDLDGDGVPELVVSEIQNGKMAFRIYKINNNVVEQITSQTAGIGMEAAISGIDYRNTQECFIVNNNGVYEIGFAVYCCGYDSGDGTPTVKTSVEVYNIGADGMVSLCASGSVQNGEGQEMFASALSPAGLNGGWNSANAEQLMSVGYAEDPYQDISEVPDPLEKGLASAEMNTEDLAVVKSSISAESGMLVFE